MSEVPLQVLAVQMNASRRLTDLGRAHIHFFITLKSMSLKYKSMSLKYKSMSLKYKSVSLKDEPSSEQVLAVQMDASRRLT